MERADPAGRGQDRVQKGAGPNGHRRLVLHDVHHFDGIAPRPDLPGVFQLRLHGLDHGIRAIPEADKATEVARQPVEVGHRLDLRRVPVQADLGEAVPERDATSGGGPEDNQIGGELGQVLDAGVDPSPDGREGRQVGLIVIAGPGDKAVGRADHNQCFGGGGDQGDDAGARDRHVVPAPPIVDDEFVGSRVGRGGRAVRAEYQRGEKTDRAADDGRALDGHHHRMALAAHAPT